MTAVDTLVKIVGLIGGVLALVTFVRNARLKRAEWLSSVSGGYYESDSHKRIRGLLEDQPELERPGHVHSTDLSKVSGESFDRLRG